MIILLSVDDRNFFLSFWNQLCATLRNAVQCPVRTVPHFLHLQMGLVCFRLKSTETTSKEEEEEVINEKLLDEVNRSGKVYMVPSRVDGEYMIRLCVHHRTTREDLSKHDNSVILNPGEQK